MRKKAPTIYDIARRAEVSVSTVSRVLNGQESVHPDLRSRVEHAMHELRFRPNRVAQTLYHRRSNTIGCVLPDITNPYFAQLFLQLEVHAFEHGYSVVLGNTTSNPELERTYLHSLVERQVDGLLFLGGLTNHPHPDQESLQIVQEVAERVPLVAVNGDLPEVDLLASVSSDEAGGMRQVLRHLRERGHTRIAFLGGQEDVTSSLAKLRVYREFCPGAPDAWVHFTGLTIQAGVDALEHLLQAPERPTALVCINDLVAAGVLQAARAAGIAVPGTFSVVGFDDVFPAQIVSPPLTSVNHNYSQLAGQALRVLLAGIAGQQTERVLQVPTFLVERQSVGPPAVTG
ncbi:LacI family DNA-binding transcriptional regulator [Deinococcus sp. S9]|uniref:LacI family DNA-binding transcriptional regulator n=1 Tax=Deinococcus sp. S9 TaxID=2545754 RepID=UPI001055ACE0|nr:LacI family DNA-binding transcriptional regulator [Deinococcus sp. S9]TDE85633.1 LacI family transcriptional regulator [Deinococcus sp. S9]